MVVKDSDKFKTLIQNRGSNNQQATSPITTSTLSTPAVTGESQTNTVVSLGSNTSYNRPPRFTRLNVPWKEEHFNAKKIKVMTDRSSDYRDRTLAMKKTSEIRQQVAKAEVNQVNMEIMCKNPEDLPDDISTEFLRLQKASILEDLQEEIKEKRRSHEREGKKAESVHKYVQSTHSPGRKSTCR
ncbi:hypothetical protein Pst134EA_031455 [Puccinia striiformis f. sp. tritici]|uniref:uncharacterized protein n=1 Tax=Puccinia striiformis f. sp. tritici TaxID=168172 RepID=UPI002008AEA5|nr:uncharacterized protein Pst134EA_031455 [Puccinia striiformis f. sp. tritici]KAH9442787.1 hypothetical protein Pst134EA_031455 [Puccinia striiformis f. sp. tritici]